MSTSDISNPEVQLFVQELATQARIHGLGASSTFASKLALEKCRLTPTSENYLHPHRGKRLASVLAKFKELFGFDPFEFPTSVYGEDLIPLLAARMAEFESSAQNRLNQLQWKEYSLSQTAGTAGAFLKWYFQTILPNLRKQLAEG